MSGTDCIASEAAPSTCTSASTQDAASPLASASPALLASVVASAALAACGGNDSSSTAGNSAGNGGGAPTPSGDGTSGTTPSATEQPYITAASKPDTLDAWRFLNQATFGPTPDDTDALMKTGYMGWIDAQVAAPSATSMYSLTKLNYELKIGRLFADPTDPDPEKKLGLIDRTHVSSAWWEKVLTGSDQLRQRVTYALSQILVISMQRGGAGDMPYACAGYYDMLLDGAFGSFTDLLTKVAGHPAMAVYLSSMSNERPVGNRIPDQNFAREIMQLFSIGLYMLNMDGSLQLDANQQPIETYSPYDIEVMSHVFTGWGWAHTFGDYVIRDHRPDSQTSQMKAYPEHHSTYDEFPKKDANGKVLRFPNATSGSITLLGKPLKITSGDAVADRQAALDILFAHQNVAPFIAKQMIQLLVTSNPSPAYVARAAKAFKDAGLNLKALVQTILLDKEARDAAAARSSDTYGKLREPILRVTQFVRPFNVKSVGGKFHVSSLQPVSGPSIAECLGQSPLESPTVFNYYRPGYKAPNSEMAKAGKVTPEMQICSETEVAAYIRFMEVLALAGFGKWVKKDGTLIGGNDTDQSQWSPQLSVYPDYTPEIKLSVDTSKTPAQRRDALVEVINRKLFGGTMSSALKDHLASLADKFNYEDPSTTWYSEAQFRFATMTFAAAVSPEYVVQR